MTQRVMPPGWASWLRGASEEEVAAEVKVVKMAVKASIIVTGCGVAMVGCWSVVRIELLSNEREKGGNLELFICHCTVVRAPGNTLMII